MAPPLQLAPAAWAAPDQPLDQHRSSHDPRDLAPVGALDVDIEQGASVYSSARQPRPPRASTPAETQTEAALFLA
jgi:hypothetical protein